MNNFIPIQIRQILLCKNLFSDTSIREIKYIPSSIDTYSTAFNAEDDSHMHRVTILMSLLGVGQYSEDLAHSNSFNPHNSYPELGAIIIPTSHVKLGRDFKEFDQCHPAGR